jgi:hypothetical protein
MLDGAFRYLPVKFLAHTRYHFFELDPPLPADIADAGIRVQVPLVHPAQWSLCRPADVACEDDTWPPHALVLDF